MMANANVLMLYLWQFPNARPPQTTQEKWLVAVLVVVGVFLSVALYRRMREDVRFLEQRKKPRELRGRRFLDRMAAGFSFQYPGGLSLRGRDLRGEDLADAFLVDADLSDTDLRGVSLRDADLERASLTSADLRGADLTGANLREAILASATYDSGTRWPGGFDPAEHGAVRSERGSRS